MTQNRWNKRTVWQTAAGLCCALGLSAPVLAAPAKAKPASTPRPAPVKPSPPKIADRPEFLRDIAPILDKQGCSVAACHGKFGGRGDLALSLLTLSPEDDYAPLVHGARGRRVNLQEPDKSLLLQKPTGDVPHAGGIRFRKGSAEHLTLLRWIQQGVPFAETDPRLTEVKVTPPANVLRAKQSVQLKVTAFWSDGREEDVTTRAIYTSSDEPIATVTDTGKVTGVRWGGTAVQVRYLGVARAAFLTIPQEQPKGVRAATVAIPAGNPIDELVFANLKRMNVTPSELSTDQQFARRAYLDAIGVMPSPDELKKFVEDTDPEKRVKLVDALLARPEFVDLRTLRLADMLRLNPRKINNNNGIGDRSVVLFNDWLRDNVARNRPYHEMVKELLLARGSLYFNGPAAYWAIERTPNDRAETTGQAFLGVRLGCARCHKHPFDRWNTDDYWNFSAFHGKVGLRNVVGGAFGEQEVFTNNGATVINQSVNGPRRGLPAVPTFLGDKPAPAGEKPTSRDDTVALAEWVTSPTNPFFARATMNRLWAQYFGRGLVHPIDDMRETTPESVPGLLDALAKEFVSSGFDIKKMIRTFLTSRTYQLSAVPNDSNALDDRFFAHHYPRPMPAQVLLDAINQVTGVQERLTAFPLLRAVELPVPPSNYFLSVFGQSHREYLTELDPKLEPNLVQTLHMMNSNYVNGKIRGGAFARTLARSKLSDEEAVDQAFLTTLCRRPEPAERAAALKAIQAARNRQEGFEDLLWSLVASREFLFVT